MTNTTYALSNKDSSSYEVGYREFLQRSDFRERIVENFSKLILHLPLEKHILEVLDVGCGNGVMTKMYINEVKKIIPKINLTLLEPAEQSLTEAVELLEPEVDAIQTKAELSGNPAFDLIIASYVFYHLSPETLNQIAEQLAPNGTLAIMMGTNDHPLKSHPKLKSVSNHGSSDKLSPFMDILLKSEKFKVSRHNVVTKLNLHGLWANNVFTHEAQGLLSFSLNKTFQDLNSASIEALNEIFESAFDSGDGSLKSVHEIIWIERIR